MTEFKTRLGAGGRLVLPARCRKALRIQTGDEVLLILDESEVRLLTPRQAVARAKALVRRHVPAGARLARELIKERRAEAKRG